MKAYSTLKEFIEGICADFGDDVFLETATEERAPQFLGNPFHFRFIPVLTARTSAGNHIYKDKGLEGPNSQLSRYEAGLRALEIALDSAVKIADSREVTINEKSFLEAKMQFITMCYECDRLKAYSQLEIEL